ncbi:HNH endonuclease [Candidatus Woesearchaeota archaeon]|nr:HNH endonuclease [Candidatus Woesearchaeota archaeon]
MQESAGIQQRKIYKLILSVCPHFYCFFHRFHIIVVKDKGKPMVQNCQLACIQCTGKRSRAIF